MQDIITEGAITLPRNPCRSVTAEEVSHYQEFGWVMLQRFAQPEMVQTVLDLARERLGDDGDSNPPREQGISYFNPELARGLKNPSTRALIKGFGKAAKSLMDRRSDIGVRWYQDVFVPKLPSSKKFKHAGNGPTNFHQDFTDFAVDRTGGMTFWMPLEAYGPESGTLSWISGSHRLGSLGNYHTYAPHNILDVYPKLRELETTDPMTYEVGDISVHAHETVHGAPANVTDRPRWAYLVIVQPADACWTGGPSDNFDSDYSNMAPWKQLDDERFPIIG